MDGSAPDSWSTQVPLAPLAPADPVQFGRFRVLGRLGSGGLGEAYLAQSDQQWAVVKAVRPNAGDMVALRARMAREVTAMGRIQSPLVAGVLAADVDAERPWFAMEYIPGVTLERWVAQYGPLPSSALLDLANQLAYALAAVHAAGVVHRDLKPANVMMSSQGPRLIDFGIADVVDATRLTQAGPAVGTLGWMAPEQVTGEPAGPATDVHAWGLTVVFAATGTQPFTGATPAALTYQILNQTPALPAGAPVVLAALASAALAKDPRRRPTIQGLLAALAAPGDSNDVAAGTSDGTIPETGHPLGMAEPAPPKPLQPPSRPSPDPGIAATSFGLTYPAPGRQKPTPGGRRPLAWAVVGGVALTAVVASVVFVALRPSSSSDVVSSAGLGAAPASAPQPAGLSSPAQPSPDSHTRAGRPPIDPTGTWTGSSVSTDGRYTYQVRLELRGDPTTPTGTVRVRNIASGNEGSWQLTGAWQDGQLDLEPGAWLVRPNGSWSRDALLLVPLTDARMNGTTAEAGTPTNPTGNIDLYR